jgi:uncharacterized membrane protein YcaP (DUF421 family)
MDLGHIFRPSPSIAEMVLRGTVMYLSLFVLMRVVLKRQSAGMGMTDVLVVVLIADAAQNGMAGGYSGVSDGLVLVATIVFWAYALDWLAFHVRWFGRFTDPPPLPLVRDGRLLRRNMRAELITEDELMSRLRLAGIDDVTNVRQAAMEGDGGISVVRASDGDDRPRGGGPRRGH